jgi:predicted GIY-YIG superfamily endonuclease
LRICAFQPKRPVAKDRLLYIGFSANLPGRIKKHDTGGVKSTASRRPLRLIFCEFFLFEEDARGREAYFKTNAGKKAIKLMLSNSLGKLGYIGKLRAMDLSIVIGEEYE